MSTSYYQPHPEVLEMAPRLAEMPAVNVFDYARVDREIHYGSPETQLRQLTHEGFRSETHREQLIGEIVAVGLPVDNYQSLHHRKNEGSALHHLGSWGIWGEQYGQFSIYEKNEAETPESRLGTIVHEGAHANTPLRKQNAYLYGGEANRAEAEQFARNLAAQSLVTGKFMDSYHSQLAAELYNGDISLDIFAEETQAIAVQLGMTNRAKLEQVEQAQHRALDRMRGTGEPHGLSRVNLISQVDHTGAITIDGIDKQLIALVRDVHGHQDLMGHIGQLKRNLYADETVTVATTRWNRQVVASNQAWAVQPEPVYKIRDKQYKEYLYHQQLMLENARRTIEEYERNQDKDDDDLPEPALLR